MKHLFTLSMLLFWGAILLSGCATTGTQPIKTVEIKVPVPTPCVSAKTPGPPVTHDTPDELKAASPGQAIRIIRAANLSLHQWVSEVAPVLDACRQ